MRTNYLITKCCLEKGYALVCSTAAVFYSGLTLHPFSALPATVERVVCDRSFGSSCRIATTSTQRIQQLQLAAAHRNITPMVNFSLRLRHQDTDGQGQTRRSHLNSVLCLESI